MEKLTLGTCYLSNYANSTGGGISPNRFLSPWFLWTVLSVAMLCFRQLKQIYLQNKIIIGI